MILMNLCNRIAISKDDVSYKRTKDLLTISDSVLVPKKQYDRELHRMSVKMKSTMVEKVLYDEDDEYLYVPYGLRSMISYLFKNSEIKYVGPTNKKLENTKEYTSNIESYRNILSGISLYDNQLDCLKKILLHKRGVIQAGTGFGKTELMCASVLILKEMNDGVIPTTLILEPTIELLNGAIKRFKKYGIQVNNYRETRIIASNKVNFAHPKSLCTDLETNKKLLDKIEVQFIDECHHSQADLFATPTKFMPNLIYSIGMSATFLSHYHVNGSIIDDFSFDELRRIGCMGGLIAKIDGKELIQNKQLGKPKLCIIHNDANEPMDEQTMDYTWNNVRKVRLQSPTRTKLIADAACVFAKQGYKVVVLMNTLDWGRSIMKEIANNGYREIVRTCFGGQVYEKINKAGKVEKDFNSALKQFDKDKVRIIVGSSCITEGIDLSKVDVCIGAMLGKSDRTTLQSVGRALRKSATGTYKYLVDFDDSQDDMLSKQFRERMIKYKKVLGITDMNDIIKNCTIDELELKFKEWENIS